MNGFLETTSVTDAGAVRQFNEDRLLVVPELGVLAVADGMGGHRSGEVASHLATQALLSGLKARRPLLTRRPPASPRMLVEESMIQANEAVYAAAQGQPALQGMGTTLATTLFHDNRVMVGHLGDSRVYRLRGQVLELLTRDDSLLRDEVEAGLIARDDAARSHNRSLITQALGVEPRIGAHLREVDAIPGDLFLLCSDGLTDLVEDRDIELILSSLWVNLPLAAAHLVDAAKDHGGFDNVSVILARVLGPFPAARPATGWGARLLGWWRRH